MRDHQHPAMRHAELRQIAVMRGGQQHAVADHLAITFDRRRAADDGRALQHELSPDRKAALDRHLVTCGACSLRFRDWRSSLGSLDQWQLPAPLPGRAAPETTLAGAGGSRAAYRAWLPALKWAAAAALVDDPVAFVAPEPLLPPLGTPGEREVSRLARVPLVQLDDAGPDAVGTSHEDSMHRRLLPGEGVLPTDRFHDVLVAKGFDGVVSVEVLSRAWRDRPIADFVHATLTATQQAWGASVHG